MKRIIIALAILASACGTTPTAPVQPVSPPCALGYVNNGKTCVRWVP